MRRSICYSDPKIAFAGQPSTLKFVYSPANTLPKGTRLKFDPLTRGRESDWEIPQTSVKGKNNLIWLTNPKGTVLQAKAVKSKVKTSPQFEFILSSEVKAGEEISIFLGANGGEGTKAQHHVQRRRPFLLYIDPKGKGDYKEPEIFNVDVKGHTLENIRVIVPSMVSKNERFDVIVRFEDCFGNLTSNAEEDSLIELSYDRLRDNLSWKLFVPETGFLNLPNLYFNEVGIYRLKLQNSSTQKIYYSSPIQCVEADDKRSMYWGSFHGESDRFNSTDQIESCLRHFRDDQALHFYSTSCFESEAETPTDVWKGIASQVSEFNEEDRFISYLGFQWYNNSPQEGVRQLIFLKDNKPLLRKKDTKSNSLKKIYKSHTPKELFSIPSFTMAKGYEFNFKDHNPEYEPAVEIYNSWGSSECTTKEGNLRPITAKGKNGIEESKEGSIREALNNDHRFGFVAGGLDDRGIFDGMYGSNQKQYSAGLTAIISTSQTRDGLVQALRDRSSIATTGCRMIIDFNIAGLPLGTVISTKAKPGLLFNRYISGCAVGTDNIKTIEIFRNGKLLKTFEPDDYRFDFEYDDMEPLEKVLIKSPKTGVKFVYYYLRMTQENGHIGWASPIWIDLEEASPEKRSKKK